MSAKIIDISICPTNLEFANGDKYDTRNLLKALRKLIKCYHPEARISIQIGHRQGDQWVLIDGGKATGASLFFHGSWK